MLCPHTGHNSTVFNQWGWYTDPDLASWPPFTPLIPGRDPKCNGGKHQGRSGIWTLNPKVDRQALYLTELKGTSLQALACIDYRVCHCYIMSLVRISCVLTMASKPPTLYTTDPPNMNISAKKSARSDWGTNPRPTATPPCTKYQRSSLTLWATSPFLKRMVLWTVAFGHHTITQQRKTSTLKVGKAELKGTSLQK
jgi:hypothetical protein